MAGFVLLAAALTCLPSTRADYLFSHIAGPLGGPGNADGLPATARFNNPVNLTIDGAGFLYVTDKGNHTVRKISPAGVVSTLTNPAGTGAVYTYSPYGVAVDQAGNIYISDDYRDVIYKIAPGGDLVAFAGSTYTHFYSGMIALGESRDGTGTDARFFAPSGLAADTMGNIYVADRGNHTIRKITSGGAVTTFAGSPAQAGTADGTGSAARFSSPSSITLDSTGNLIVGDATTIRKISPDGVVTTVAGPTGPSESGSPALNRPQVAIDAAGNIFIADTFNDTVRKITPSGVLTTLAGTAGQAGSSDGSGAAARFDFPSGLVVDRTGNILVTDSGNDSIRKITPSGVVSTFSGKAGGYGRVDGTGSNAQFNQPWGISLDAAGNFYVADRGNGRVRKITPGGEVTTQPNSIPEFREPVGTVVDAAGNIFCVDAGNTLRKTTPDGVTAIIAGRSYLFGSADGPLASATFAYPLGIAINRAGIIYIADAGNRNIRVITPDNLVSTLAIQSSFPGLFEPNGLALDGNGNLYVADRGSHTVRKITPNGAMTILAGDPWEAGSTDGMGTAARLNGPCGVAVDSKGNVFVTDTGSNTIRKISPAGLVTTVGGNPQVYGSADGIGSSAHFYAPHGIAIDGSDTLYITEEWNHAIRRGVIAGPPAITTQPLTQTVAPGGNVQISVTAAAVPAPTYQWYFNGGTFSGATTNTLSFTNARNADAGDYTVVVTNELGSVTSAKAALTISSAPVTSPSTPAPTAGGGGSIEGWFVVAILALGGASRVVAQRNSLKQTSAARA